MCGLWEGGRLGGGSVCAGGCNGAKAYLPTNPDCEGSLVPVSACCYGHLACCVGAGPVEDLVGVAMFGGVEFVRMGVRS